MSPLVEHGGRDAGPAPVVDASTNANPLGPSPMAIAAVRSCELGPYPDPAYTRTRRALADAADTDPAAVVVGAGATELIHRIVAACGGPVLVEDPTFGEYAAAAARAGTVIRAADPGRFVDELAGAAVAFVASPGNPDGRVRDATWCEQVSARAAATGTVLVWDLAYAPFVDVDVPVPGEAVALHAPNKVHGVTGLRAGWLTAPVDLATRLRAAGISWMCSSPGAAFLEATTTLEATRWVAGCRPVLARWRDALAAGLADLGLTVAAGDAPFVVVDVPDATRVAARLRARHGVKVRDTTSLGRAGSWRVAAQPPEQQRLLLDAVADVLEDAP